MRLKRSSKAFFVLLATTAVLAGTQVSANAATKVPGDVLDLTNWKLTLPTKGDNDNPAEIKQPALKTYTSKYFKVNEAGNAVVFQANAGGYTTSGSSYPRSELREMSGGGATKASWSTTKGKHTMTVRAAITHLPVVKPQVVVAQVHGAEDDVAMIRLDGPHHLYVEHDGDNYGDLDKNYKLGTTFDVQFVVSGGHIIVNFNGAKKADFTAKGSGNYFKAGCYTQSNTDKGDKASAYGETVISQLKVTHE